MKYLSDIIAYKTENNVFRSFQTALIYRENKIVLKYINTCKSFFNISDKLTSTLLIDIIFHEKQYLYICISKNLKESLHFFVIKNNLVPINET